MNSGCKISLDKYDISQYLRWDKEDSFNDKMSCVQEYKNVLVLFYSQVTY